MLNFLSKYGVEILLSLATAGALFFCKYIYSKMQKYKKLAEGEDQDNLIMIIQKELNPVKQEIVAFGEIIKKMENENQQHLNAIVRSYKFRLIQLCKGYLERGHMTPEEFEQLSEFYKLYTDLGGNGQAAEYYEKTKNLPIQD